MATNKVIAWVYGVIIVSSPVLAASHSFEAGFEVALSQQKQGQYTEALETYQHMSQAEPAELSAVRFNMGLCQLELAKSAEQESLQLALQEMQRAQACFLQAKRLRPDFQRAGQRLDSLARLISATEKRIELEQQTAEKLQEQIQALFDRLQKLVDDQKQLHAQIPDLSRRPAAKRNRNAAAKPPAAPPLPASEVIAQWPVTQQTLTETGQAIEAELSELDQVLSTPVPGQPSIKSFLSDPLKLMTTAVATQRNAKPYLFKQEQWPLARREMQTAIGLMEEILRMMAQDSESDESDEYSDMEDDNWEDYEESDEDGGQSMNMPGKGELAQGSDMQPLPVPNYSMEDILQEEAQNQQFRQQNRSKANAAKVKKDW